MAHDAKQLAYWILSNAAAVESGGVEFNFPCPHCGHTSHYFNVKKAIGFCHKAGCKRVTTVAALEQAFGNTPDSVVVGYVSYEHEVSAKQEVPVKLPVGVDAIVYRVEGTLYTNYPEVVTQLEKTRFIDSSLAHRWGLLLDPIRERIIIPVFFKGTLQNYVSRSVWWKASVSEYKRYEYPKGHNIKRWLFGWDEAKTFQRLTLVENTFNAIWLRSTLHCTSNFGSDLSKQQIDLIFKSKVQEVTFLWDYGAEQRTQKAMNALSKVGVDCRMVKLTEEKQQPDNWTLNELVAMTQAVWRI